MDNPTFIFNHDLVGLWRRINRFIEELMGSVSANGSELMTADKGRLHSYIKAIESYHVWVAGQPQLDLPETHPRSHPLPPAPEITEVENESIIDLVNLLVIARDEMASSQSARDAAGIKSFDSVRLTAITSKAKRFLVQYVEEATPLDLPESSPMREAVQEGRTGVLAGGTGN